MENLIELVDEVMYRREFADYIDHVNPILIEMMAKHSTQDLVSMAMMYRRANELYPFTPAERAYYDACLAELDQRGEL